MFFPFGKRPRPPFPDAWRRHLDAGVLYCRLLDAGENARLREIAQILVAEKQWEGCAGQIVTDEIKVVIAAQAAILLLGRDDYRFDDLDTILVYPGSFLGSDEDSLGHAKRPDVRIGEAMHGGPVAVAWWHARWAGRRLGECNVVLHEFAHKLAELGDPDTSRPPFLERALWSRWDRVMTDAREQLEEDDDYGRATLIDPYGATDAFEFFAVATETFFMRPLALRERHAEVYELLAACYRQDPAKRPMPPDVEELARGAEEEYSRHAIDECTAALKTHPNLLEAYHDRAAHLLALGDVDGALADYAAIVARAKGAERAETLFDRAQIFDELGRADEAIDDLSAAVAACPEYGAALGHRGHLLAGKGDLDAALRDLDAAVKLDKRDDLLRRWRAEVHRRSGRLELALKDADRAIRLYPDEPAHHVERARILLAQGETAAALAACDEALRLDADDVDARTLRAEMDARGDH